MAHQLFAVVGFDQALGLSALVLIVCLVISVGKRKIYPLACGLVVCGLIHFLLPVLARHPRSYRAECRNNLKQIALALHYYHDEWKRFPPAVTYDEDGRALHSWRVLILPYLEEKALFDAYNLAEPWDGPNNSKLREAMPQVFRCPAAKAEELGSVESDRTNYVAIASAGPSPDGWIGTAWPDNTSLAFRDLIDGSSNVILLAESSTDPVVWTQPRDLRYETLPLGINHETGVGLSSQHPGCCCAALADGSVRVLGETISPETLRKLLLCNDGEPVGDF